MRALLIDVDFRTGVRAGGIDPKDPGLRCWTGWQKWDDETGLGQEMRLVLDDERPLAALKGVPGVTILNLEHKIDEALARFDQKDTRYMIDPVMIPLLALQVQQQGVQLPTRSYCGRVDELERHLHAQGVVGIKEIKPRKVDRIGAVYARLMKTAVKKK